MPNSLDRYEDFDATHFLDLLGRELQLPSHAAYERAVLEESVRTLAQSVLEQSWFVRSGDPKQTLEAIIASIDRKLAEQLNPILHHGDFQALEASWRGLWFLCSEPSLADTPNIRIRVLNARKSELLRDYHASDRWDHALSRAVYVREAATPGGTPFSAILADYDFADDALDIQLLGCFARVGSLASVSFIAAASPELLRLRSFDTVEQVVSPGFNRFGAFVALQNSPESCFVSLALPRILIRAPYTGAKDQHELEFWEECHRPEWHVWARPVWLIGVTLIRSYARDGWFAALGQEGLGSDALAHHAFEDDDCVQQVFGPVERALSHSQERQIASIGLLPVALGADGRTVAVHWPTTLHKAVERDRAGILSANPSPASDLRAVLCAGRVAQALKSMWYAPLRQRTRLVANASSFDRRVASLREWLDLYVAREGAIPDALRPLASAELRVEAIGAGGRRPEAMATLMVAPGYGFNDLGAPGAIKMEFRLEVAYPQGTLDDSGYESNLLVQRMGQAEAAADTADAEVRVPPFRLKSVLPCESADVVAQDFANALEPFPDGSWHMVLGPWTVQAVVEASRPVEELVAFLLDDESSLEIDVTGLARDVTVDPAESALMVRYPSGVIRGLSGAVCAGPSGARTLRLSDALAVLDPAQTVAPLPERALISEFDVIVLSLRHGHRA